MQDIIEFFEDYDIEYWKSGKNVTHGWINIQCIFCDDNSNHLGIRLNDFKCHCWKCGPKSILKILKEITGSTYSECKNILVKLNRNAIVLIDDDPTNKFVPVEENDLVHFPPEMTKHIPKLHREYLRKRNFPPLKTIREWKLKAVYTTGKFKYRLIIPIIKNRKVASFTARDVTDQAEVKYLHASGTESLLTPKNLIYNFDSVTRGSDCVLVEGPTDVWRLGKKAICMFGVNPSGPQMVELAKKQIDTLFILFDSDKAGAVNARKVAKILAPVVRILEVVKLKSDAKDPGDLAPEEAELIMRTLGLRD